MFLHCIFQVETTLAPVLSEEAETNKINSVPAFTPTISPTSDSNVLPKNSRFNVNYDVTVQDGSDEKLISGSEVKSSRFDKYSRKKVKNSLFHKKDTKSREEDQVEADQEVKVDEAALNPLVAFFQPKGVPLGANTDIFKNYAGDQLSQADFERKILGVSTATEISVKSMICVKGRCFNADEQGSRLK